MPASGTPRNGRAERPVAVAQGISTSGLSSSYVDHTNWSFSALRASTKPSFKEIKNQKKKKKKPNICDDVKVKEG